MIKTLIQIMTTLAVLLGTAMVVAALFFAFGNAGGGTTSAWLLAALAVPGWAIGMYVAVVAVASALQPAPPPLFVGGVTLGGGAKPWGDLYLSGSIVHKGRVVNYAEHPKEVPTVDKKSPPDEARRGA